MFGRILLGFVAAMLAVLAFHQPMILALSTQGQLPPTVKAFNMGPMAAAPAAVADLFKTFGFGGWPVLFNTLFWGGLWGALFGLVQSRLPGGMMIIKGLIFGLLILVFSNWLALPLLRGQPIFGGYVPQRMLVSALISGSFGLGLGLIYGLLRRGD
jgi:hypothetical protein